MLNQSKNIDQLFLDKLGEYEKTPPSFILVNIQGKLTANRMNRRFAILKTVGIAAAIVLAFLAGWMMTSQSEKDTLIQNSITQQGVINSKVAPSTDNNAKTTSALPETNAKSVSATSQLPVNINSTVNSSLASIVNIAPNTSVVGSDKRSTDQKIDEMVLVDTEKDFLDKLQTNFKKLKDWVVTVGKESVADNKKDTETINIDPFNNKTSEGSVSIALNTAGVTKGRWSLKAEISPVFNGQAQNSSQSNDIKYSNATQISKPQETTTENTLSGGMVAGYNVSKRLTVKSGFVYNSIRQTTRNIGIVSVNPLYTVTGNGTLAPTPAGQVSFGRAVGVGISNDVVLDANSQLSNPTKYSLTNELKQDIEFIEIPVQATYKLVDRKFNIGLTGGISTNILVGNKAVLSENGERISNGETSNMRNVVYAGAVGLEIGYDITNRITLTFEPRLKQFINSLSTSKSVNYKPSQMGIVTGLTYSFN